MFEAINLKSGEVLADPDFDELKVSLIAFVVRGLSGQVAGDEVGDDPSKSLRKGT
jgi:hypothetical protein